MATAKSTKTKTKSDPTDVVPVAHEYDWPARVYDVDVEAFEELTFPELRLFLAMMGIDPERQAHLRTKKDLAAEIHVYVARDSVRAQLAYDRVIRGEPEPETDSPPRTNLWTANDFWPTYSRLMEKTKQDLSQNVLQDMVTTTSAEVTRRVTEKLSAYVDEEAKKVRRIEVVMPDGKATKIKGVMHEKFDMCVQILSQGFPLLLVGPTQCGKTTLAKQLADAMKLGFTAQSFSGGLTESKLLGRVLPGAGGAAKFIGTPFLDAFENGKVFLADEFDAGDPNVLTSLNMGVANGEIWLPERDAKPVAMKHAKFRLIAATNTFGFGADARYVGRNALDYATLERFGCGVVYMDYDARIETSLARQEICDWAWNLRRRIRRAQLNREMSTRTIAVLETMTKAYNWTRTEWDERFFANWSQEERRLLAA